MTKVHAMVVFTLVLATGCGKDKENAKSKVRAVDALSEQDKATTDAPDVSISIINTPAGALDQGASFQFVALVKGSADTDVEWSTVGGGSINASGLFVAPAAGGQVTVVATSTADDTKKDEVKVTVKQVSVTASGPNALYNTESADYTATVAGTKLGSGVNWSVTGSGDVGAIDAAGHFTPNMARGAYAATIVATSAADASKSASVSVQVNAATYAVTPDAVDVFVNETAQLGIAAAGLSAEAQWSTDGGSINASGLYTAPATVGTYTVTAVHPTLSSFTATAAMNVVLRPIITIAVPATNLLTGSSTTFSASVTDGSAGVTWSVAEGAAGGTIDAGGNYTAPAAGGVFHIVATHAEYPGASTTIEIIVCAAFDGLVTYWDPGTQPVASDDVATLRVRLAYGDLAAHTTYQDLQADWLEVAADDVLHSTSYNGAGLDGQWLTSDDDVAAYFSLIADGSGVQTGYARHGTAGTDGIFGTADDEILEMGAIVRDAGGFVQEVTRYTGAGLDGAWGTGDDVVGGSTTYVYDASQFLVKSYSLNGGGNIAGYRTYENDASGRPLTVTSYTHPGSGNVWEDGNDRFNRKWLYAYDGAGRVTSRIEQVFVGPSNTPQPQNDTRVEYAYADAGNLPSGMTQFSAGADKAIGTGDDATAAFATRESVCPY